MSLGDLRVIIGLQQNGVNYIVYLERISCNEFGGLQISRDGSYRGSANSLLIWFLFLNGNCVIIMSGNIWWLLRAGQKSDFGVTSTVEAIERRTKCNKSRTSSGAEHVPGWLPQCLLTRYQLKGTPGKFISATSNVLKCSKAHQKKGLESVRKTVISASLSVSSLGVHKEYIKSILLALSKQHWLSPFIKAEWFYSFFTVMFMSLNKARNSVPNTATWYASILKTMYRI